MGVVRWFYPVIRTTRADKKHRETRAETMPRSTRAEYEEWGSRMIDGCGPNGSHGYAEMRDKTHLGEGPP